MSQGKEFLFGAGYASLHHSYFLVESYSRGLLWERMQDLPDAVPMSLRLPHAVAMMTHFTWISEKHEDDADLVHNE